MFSPRAEPLPQRPQGAQGQQQALHGKARSQRRAGESIRELCLSYEYLDDTTGGMSRDFP